MVLYVEHGRDKNSNTLVISNKKTKEIFFTKKVQLEHILPLRRRFKKRIKNFDPIEANNIDLPLDTIVEIEDDMKEAFNEFNLNIEAINGAKHKIIFFGDIKEPLFFDYNPIDEEDIDTRSDFLLITHLTYDPETKTLHEKLLMEVSLTKTGPKLFNEKAINYIWQTNGTITEEHAYFESQWEEGVKNRFKDLVCAITDKQADFIFPFLMQRLLN